MKCPNGRICNTAGITLTKWSCYMMNIVADNI
uniref:Uncharacterized protein n=1 Tax=Anguilla anguilla TaxID=7936 RepID=A0A0E9VR48_ANGAN